MSSIIEKILSCVINEDKEEFSSLLRNEMNQRIQSERKTRIPDAIEDEIFSSKNHQTLNISEEQYRDSIKFIPILNELANKKGNISVVFSDDSEAIVTSSEVDSLIKLHDSLNEDNQVILRSSLVRSKESYKSCANFAKKYTTKKGQKINVQIFKHNPKYHR